ncbi:hypothetical protein [Anaerobranca gottschalkii]|uniref:Replication restart DNA helicase PriA n=1 Tax=Anaerobranca gottschalkii DSM 13577 TaxID=1120990 RepID=A0A1H9YJ35_9FIRM|nr:hypothetical protein [Anaerobranca gottschalkii]SES69048.1 replication restart DNA helicase PriA [Anaerobranca gottschalkii DSM 13577]
MEAIKKDTERFTCPGCGANIKFNPKEQSMTCPYCDTKIQIQEEIGEITEYCFKSFLENPPKEWDRNQKVIHCDSCGADTIIEAHILSKSCPFCGSSHIVQDSIKAGIPPETLIPFKIGKKEAEEKFRVWIGKKFFAPNTLKEQYISHKLEGLYLPFWTYDAQTSSLYTAQAGTYYWVTETHWTTVNGKRQRVTRQVRKIRWRHVSGSFSQFFDDVLVLGSTHVNEKIINKIKPFNLRELVYYKPEYLSGFITEKYSVGLKEGWQAAKREIDLTIRSGIIRQINADEVKGLNINTNYNDIKFKHLLLPVWISAYTYKGKRYQFMINGQTGRIDGEAPISPWKVAFAVLTAIMFIFIIISVIRMY